MPASALLLLALVTSAQKPVTTWKPPYEVVAPAPTADGLASHLNGGKTAVWLEGDVLNFLMRTDAVFVRLTGSIQQPMTNYEGTDLWIARLRMPDWDSCLVRYRFYTSDDPGQVQIWRGKNAPEPVTMAKERKGQIVERTIMSAALGEERKLTIYLPPNAPKEGLPAFFMADGQSCNAFADALEPLILAHKVRPVAIIGVNNGGDRNAKGSFDPALNFRAKEYVPGQDPERFEKHLKFFAEEVPAWAAKELGVSTNPQDRAIFGYSDGGSFSAAASLLKPDVFGAVMPLSPGVPSKFPKPAGKMPTYYFGAGRLEAFSIPTNHIYHQMLDWGAKATMRTYFSSHDENTWLAAFVDFAPQIFPG